MALQALLDTNICIYIARHRPPSMAERFAAAAPGEIRAVLERAGTPIGNSDLWIAAHARSLGTKLVTNNMREFVRVPGIELDCW
jgi:tRNA(fMet)-specific endonuclease VapC